MFRRELQLYLEPLNGDELKFLVNKETKERKQYYKVFRLLTFLSFIIPFAVSWHRALDGVVNAFDNLRFFTNVTVLLSISLTGTYLSYRINLRKVQQDIKHHTKTIEVARITRKLFEAQNGTYHLYLDSPFRLNIEVSQKDYHHLSEGDEVCIEYTTYSKQYLGYF